MKVGFGKWSYQFLPMDLIFTQTLFARQCIFKGLASTSLKERPTQWSIFGTRPRLQSCWIWASRCCWQVRPTEASLWCIHQARALLRTSRFKRKGRWSNCLSRSLKPLRKGWWIVWYQFSRQIEPPCLLSVFFQFHHLPINILMDHMGLVSKHFKKPPKIKNMEHSAVFLCKFSILKVHWWHVPRPTKLGYEMELSPFRLGVGQTIPIVHAGDQWKHVVLVFAPCNKSFQLEMNIDDLFTHLLPNNEYSTWPVDPCCLICLVATKKIRLLHLLRSTCFWSFLYDILRPTCCGKLPGQSSIPFGGFSLRPLRLDMVRQLS